jgi:CRP/FNR family transcriptional regulator
LSEQLTRLLRGVSFFNGLSEDALEAVAARMVHRSAPAGQILFRKGEQARGVYLLTEGRVEIYRSTSDGREQVIHSELPVQSVAELPVFDGGEYPASGRAAEPCELYFLSMDDFQRLYREHPEIADAVIRNLGKRLRVLVKLVERVSLKNVPDRVASALLDYAEKAGALQSGEAFRLPRTQEELAHELATSRESVARALADLRKKGIISQEGRRIRILSVQGLEQASLGDDPPLVQPQDSRPD